jgi:hypothetical protein
MSIQVMCELHVSPHEEKLSVVYQTA